MKLAPIEADEDKRLAALHRYQILDTLAEVEFDDFTKLASHICGTPIALISLVDADRQWFKSRVGLDAQQTPRDISFCGHAIHGREVFEVPNALDDERFRDNPLVTQAPDIRFYAGAPLITPDGHGIGTLCVIDRVPHQLSTQQRDALAMLGRLLVQQLELKSSLGREQALSAQLQRQSAFQKALIDSAGAAVISTTMDGIITSFNAAAEKMLGYQAAELIDKQSPAIFHDLNEVVSRAQELSIEHGRDIAPGFDVFVLNARVGSPETRRWTYIQKDGTRFPVQLTISSVRGADGAVLGFLGVALDMTEQQKTEANQAQLAAIVASSTDAIMSKTLDGIVTSWNPAATRLFGYTEAEMIGQPMARLIPVGREEEEPMILEKIRNGQDIEHFDTVRQRKDGEQFHVSVNLSPIKNAAGVIIGASKIARDISERIRAQAAIQDRENRIRVLVDTIVDGIVVIDAKGSIQTFNPAAIALFGYTVEEVLGKNVNMLMPQPYAAEHDGYLHNYLSTGHRKVIGIGREVVGQRKDGSTFPMELAVGEMQVSGERMFTGIVRDITERKRAELVKNEFVSTVSHELRTPLTSIQGALGLVCGGMAGTLPDKARTLVDIALKNSKRLTALINDLLDMEKIAAGKMHFDMQPRSLIPLIEQAIEANQNYGSERHVTLSLTTDVQNVNVRVDSERLAQVLANLLSNAIKYSPPNGTVEISVHPRATGVRVQVRDHGLGIPPEFQNRIFQKFAQADSSDTREKGGTGLGLAISRELIERMGGSIGFESTPGQGATFYFELPLWSEPAPHYETAVLAGTAGDAPRILVVDDDPDIANLLRLMLTGVGYVVDTVCSGMEALSAMQKTRYAAMTLDLMMPGMGGLSVISQVRQQASTQDLPIIVVSAKVEEGKLAIDGVFSGIDWLAKPVDEKRLFAAVANSLPAGQIGKQRVLHVEDDTDLHEVVRAMVGGQFDFELATTLAQARTRIAQERFDVVMLDLTLPDGSGWDLLPMLRAQQPQARVVVLSGGDMTPDEVAKVEAALLKSRVSPNELFNAIRAGIHLPLIHTTGSPAP